MQIKCRQFVIDNRYAYIRRISVMMTKDYTLMFTLLRTAKKQR